MPLKLHHQVVTPAYFTTGLGKGREHISPSCGGPIAAGIVGRGGLIVMSGRGAGKRGVDHHAPGTVALMTVFMDRQQRGTLNKQREIKAKITHGVEMHIVQKLEGEYQKSQNVI
jgi:hypothetical protein